MDSKKPNVVKEYWPQLSALVMFLLFLGGIYSEFKSIKKTQETLVQSQKQFWSVINEKIDKTIETLNDEDDGVRSDFEHADQSIRELEDMRERAQNAEYKLYVEQRLNQLQD